MFANLTKGAPVYVLDTRETPKCYMASLKEAPQPYFPPQGGMMPAQPYVSIVIGDQPWAVPVNADMASKDGIVVTTSRERMIDAINAARQQSQAVVDSYDRHRANLEVYDRIMREISPAYAGHAQHDAELQKLRKEVEQLRKTQEDVASMRASLDALVRLQTSTKTDES